MLKKLLRVKDLFHDGTKFWLFRGMQIVLIGILGIGIYTQNLGIIVNSAIALGITFLPAYLEHDQNIAFSSGIVLWITLAVMLHAAGTLGPYRTISWWDSVTHALSSSVVAGVGYATVRAIDEHSDAIYLPQRFMFLFILMFVLAFGVFWEIVEFLTTLLGQLLGAGSILTQYGLSDTILDLVFNTLGALIFALWGTENVTHTVASIREKLDHRQAIREIDS